MSYYKIRISFPLSDAGRILERNHRTKKVYKCKLLIYFSGSLKPI